MRGRAISLQENMSDPNCTARRMLRVSDILCYFENRRLPRYHACVLRACVRVRACVYVLISTLIILSLQNFRPVFETDVVEGFFTLLRSRCFVVCVVIAVRRRKEQISGKRAVWRRRGSDLEK